MNIEKQCCLLEQAKRLNELGVAQGLSLFFYDCGSGKTSFEFNRSNEIDGMYFDAFSCYSAFTVAELGVMLPEIDVIHWDVHPLSNNNARLKRFYNAEVCYHSFGAWSNEAEARAAILIHLLETNRITADEVNERLKNS